VRQFTSAAYGWMWPFRGQVERWYDQAVQRLLDEGRPGISRDAQ
jgi:hypothetical protein